MKRFRIITKLIVLALIVYAVTYLVGLQGRVDAMRKERDEVQRLVDEKKLTNAELEYGIEHYDDSDVKENIARTQLGYVHHGEIVFYDGGAGQGGAD